jgi:hypothetical protein|tara:strand:- start:4149 stop:4424 length:276 start_codon:yes stop_codon:yes gene_type:complete
MSIQTLNAVYVRHGVIEENDFYWAKVGTLSEDVQSKKGFQGQQFIEYSVDSESARRLAQQLDGKLPASIDFDIAIKVEKGKPVMVLSGIAD